MLFSLAGHGRMDCSFGAKYPSVLGKPSEHLLYKCRANFHPILFIILCERWEVTQLECRCFCIVISCPFPASMHLRDMIHPCGW